MPIPEVTQPEILPISSTLRLRRFDGFFDFAFDWYQDIETVWLVDGVRVPYTREKLERMYRWLDTHGELYFIETLENGTFKPIGDVCFWQEDMPIVIGDRHYRGKGIGKKVVSALIQRGRALEYPRIYVRDIYNYNTASRKCFESAGFRICESTEEGYRLVMDLQGECI